MSRGVGSVGEGIKKSLQPNWHRHKRKKRNPGSPQRQTKTAPDEEVTLSFVQFLWDYLVGNQTQTKSLSNTDFIRLQLVVMK